MTSNGALPDASAGDATTAALSPAVDVVVGARLRRARRPVVVICLVFLAILVGIAILAPLLMPEVATQRSGDLLRINESPSPAHLLGTDTQGRDVLQRLLVGTQVTFIGVVEGLIAALIVGVPIGLVAGYFRGRLDRVVSWLADLGLSLPGIVVVVMVLSVFQASLLAAMTVFGVLAAPGLMRVVRSVVLQVREELYISAAVVAGLTPGYIIFRHVLPRIRGALIVQISLLAASAILVQTGLAFLGLLESAPAPSWGGMIADGLGVIVLQPWLIVPPGVAIVITVLVFGFLADSFTGKPVVARGRRSRLQNVAAPEPITLSPSENRGDLVLDVRELRVAIRGAGDPLRILDGVTFSIKRGEAVGIVGESGCGKSITASAIARLLPDGGEIESGSVVLEGNDISKLSERELRGVRGRDIGFVSQEPMIALNPALRIGAQLSEVVRIHHRLSKAEARRRVVELLASVRLPDPEEVARKFPHELSGGMAQRVGIARALAGEPKLLIADEPTTALDVTVQAEILELLRELQHSRGMALLLVTHDWGVVADICNRAVVMYAGQVIETTEVETIFNHPKHPYTKLLLESDPHRADVHGLLPTIPGMVPPPGTWPKGCRFAERCPFVEEKCRTTDIPLEVASADHVTRCIRHNEILELQSA